MIKMSILEIHFVEGGFSTSREGRYTRRYTLHQKYDSWAAQVDLHFGIHMRELLANLLMLPST
jgi:hypothetical protein